ncbi:UDP-glucoronosyl and UDP-glucosyl transferase [Oesophagostomum dentatum]|uniref:glucuronosyltransferase n=1 Tax=Oesophagostomum dentatum TaxID=61180 RepID=A0A0B1SU47_OESDE|nr:UDP-glucoronosyl and UDP-glucosyl transferase [Oesophagostomum dentatum]
MDPHVDMVGHHSALVQIPYISKYYDPNDYLDLDIKGSALWATPRMEGRCFSMEDLEKFMRVNEKLCRGIFEDTRFVRALRDCSFDVALHEAYELCAVAVLEMIDVKNTIVVSALGVTPYIQEIAGFAANPSFIPGMFTTYSDEMTFWERMDNFKFEIEMYYWRASWEKHIWKLANKARPRFPELRRLLKEKTGVVLINVNEITESPRPTANILRYIGGATIREPRKLNERLNAILNERRENVYFSLGSLAQSKDMPMHLKQEVIDAFASFPNTTFIWKYEGEGDAILFEKYPNIYPIKWLPQVDLLADDRLSLFITHAGMNSVLEATFYGKPMIAIPLFVDQILNAKNMRSRGLAVMIDMHDLSRDTLVSAIHETIRANRYA